MEKPTVFLSHSSLDKAPLAALKKLLDTRAAGSLNFFLSSDGESIRFGRNWVVRISDALSQAKLMFLFLSPHSADSKWIHFEAGCAYAKDIQVIPVCLPGIDLNQIKAPLNLLQGFNLHSHETMGNLARICNETFDMKIQEAFSSADFEPIVSKISAHGSEFFGDHAWTVDAIELHSSGSVLSDGFNPIPALDEICRSAGANCFSRTNGELPKSITTKFEQPGCVIKFENHEVQTQVKKPGNPAVEWVGTGQRKYKLECTLSPELFQINAALLDKWLQRAQLSSSVQVQVEFNNQIIMEKRRQDFTAKLYRGGIKMVENGYEYEGFLFGFSKYSPLKLEYGLLEKLEDDRLPKLIGQLFKTEVLWQRDPDFSEMFPNS